MATRLRRTSRRSGRNGIAKLLLTMVIIFTVLVTATTTFILVTLRSQNLGSEFSGVSESNFLSSPSDLLPISSNNMTNVNQTSTACTSGNWSAIYAQYEMPLNAPSNSTLGQQYLNDPQ